MTRFDRTLIREVLIVTATVCAVLLIILVSMSVSRVLGRAVSGEMPASAVFSFILLKSTEKLSLLLPLALYVAQLLVLGRLHKDHEIDAWYACGLGVSRLYRALLISALPVFSLVLVLGVWVAPWAAKSGEAVVAKARSQTDVSGFAAGRFSESSDGRRVFYAQRISPDGASMENVFVFARGRSPEQKLIATAKSARVELDRASGQRFLILEHGFRYDGVPLLSDFRRIAFERHGVLLAQREIDQTPRRETMTTGELWAALERSQQLELQWRLSFPLATLVLTLFVVPIGSLPPRKGRYARVPLGLLMYILYSNALGVNRSFVESGAVPLWMGAWWPHVIFAGVALFLIARMTHWRRWTLVPGG